MESTTAEELARCDREMAELQARDDIRNGTAPAWLVTLGMTDWEMEKRLIESEGE